MILGGRGMKQLTHDYNYLAYYDYVHGSNYFNLYMKTRVGYSSVASAIGKHPELDDRFYSNLKIFAKEVSSNLFYAFDSAGWFSTINAPRAAQFMDEGIDDLVIGKVTKVINGGTNNLKERILYTNLIKEFMEYDDTCQNK